MQKIYCAAYDCRYREAKWVNLTELARADTDRSKARTVRCSIHKGAEKRVKWRDFEHGPITQDVIDAIERVRAEDAAAEEKRAADRLIERRKIAKVWAGRRWEAEEAAYEVVKQELSQHDVENGRHEWRVYHPDTPESERDWRPLYTVRVTDNQEFDDIPDTFSFQVNNNGGTGTVMEAIALADALQKAAMFMVSRNYERKKKR